MFRTTHSIFALILITTHSLLLTSTPLAAATFCVGPANASVKFTIGHLVVSTVSGRFNEFRGTIRYDKSDLTESSLVGTIKAASIDTDNQSRDNHLRSEDFFDVANHPEIRFESKRVERREVGAVLIGELTMRGVRREIEIPFTVEAGKGEAKIAFAAELELNRQDYGIAYGGFLDAAAIGDMVTIELFGEALRKATMPEKTARRRNP